MLADRWRAALAAPGTPTGGDARWWWPTPTTRWWSGPPATAPPGAWVGGRPGVAGRRRGLPGLRWSDRLRRADWACDRCGFARAGRSDCRRGWAADLVLADGRATRSASACRAGSTPPTPPWPRGGRCCLGVPARGRTLDGHRPPSTRWPGASPPSSGGGRPVRLLLAKNPAGWTGCLRSAGRRRAGRPVVLSASTPGSPTGGTRWLWDVPFERLAGRPVVATGDRRLDLAVRLPTPRSPTTCDDPSAAPTAVPLAPAGRRRARSSSSATTPPSPTCWRVRS